ncbi:hypothetical protein J3A83DRAFT_4083853 [Scleroderma citrinum]
MAHITDLPLELIEHILYTLDPLDVSRIAQSSQLFRELIYGTRCCQQFWRGLYLAQPLDDPRRTVTHLGYPRMAETSNINWQGELQRIIRARTVVLNSCACREGEWGDVLKTLLDVATTLPPVPFQESDCTSRNVVWVLNLLHEGAFFDFGEEIHGRSRPDLTTEELQLLARLHTWVGLTRRDLTHPQKRIASRAFVYDLRNCGPTNHFGPFMMDGSMRVDWKYMQALAHVYGMVWIEIEREDMGEYDDFGVDGDVEQRRSPFSLTFCQCVIPPGMNLDMEQDWAGIEGLWYIGYCFLDHREFLSKGFFASSPYLSSSPPLDTSIFEGDDVSETHASVVVYFRVIGVEPDPVHPTRPKINYAGELDGKFSMLGSVKLTPDDQVWWHFGGGNGDQPVWNCEGIGLGGVCSQAGVLGVWSTVFHDAEDPVGPFWMRREKFIVD